MVDKIVPISSAHRRKNLDSIYINSAFTAKTRLTMPDTLSPIVLSNMMMTKNGDDFAALVHVSKVHHI